MKLGMPITYAGDFRETIANLRDFESVGLDRVMVPRPTVSTPSPNWGSPPRRPSGSSLPSGFFPCSRAAPPTWR